ncbi:alpha-ketoglutarate-dependent dioxygenase AlkB [Actinokineospora inagensis]|uniref:alpha-ketoglutarate-dependent dioxygenase AlkB n=1 Tax=Actinokineospora inagensis TaxID=103730 RepID=UPI00047CE2A7|nr:alpha-ketoglutarate-dependent dioxygenase AlkB [Actinokineospora inagensis]
MVDAFQSSLFESTPGLAPLTAATRVPLTDGAWLDVLPGWLAATGDLFTRLVDTVPWHAERRQMYDSVVGVPRLLAFYREGAPLPDPILLAAKEALSAHYATPFVTAGLCLYRDGADSVAWHGDRIGRGAHSDTFVAIVSLGATRPLLLRPRDGGKSRRVPLAHGDLVVMGGSCQRTWDHAVPKVRERTGARISVQFRPAGVR